MMTSALALSQILSAVAAKPKAKERFLKTVADLLGLVGEEAEIEAMRHVSRLARSVSDDISSLELDGVTKSVVMQDAAPFRGFLPRHN